MQTSTSQSQLAEATGPPCIGNPQPLRSLFANAASRHPKNTAVASLFQKCMPALRKETPTVTENLVWTYKQLDEASDLLAAAFHDRGIRKGMRIAGFLFNGAEWALLFWSSLKLGAIFVPLDARSVSRQEEVQHYMKVVVPAVLVVGDKFAAETLQQNNALDLPDTVLQVVANSERLLPDGWTSLHDVLVGAHELEGKVGQIEEAQNDTMKDVVLIVFTSGTSGLPKACPHTNMNLWTSYQAVSLLRPSGPDDSVVQHLPPSHIFACLDMVQFWSEGAAVVYPAKAFDAKATLEAIEKLQCTYISALPGLFLALVTHPSLTRRGISSLRRVVFGGTMISPQTIAAAADPEQFDVQEVIAGFGMSEVIPVFGTSPRKPLKVRNGFLGFDMMLAGAKSRICDLESRKVLRRGEVGELHLGGSGVIGGYSYGDNKVFYDDEGGHWIATGDQAKMEEDGTLYIMGRYKDIIIRGGENLSPALIENCLEKTGVRAQVIGVPDDIAGEVPVAIIQHPGPGPFPLDQMQALVQASLGPQSAPVAYLNLHDLSLQAFPMTTSGKVRKDQLKTITMNYLSVQAHVNGVQIHSAVSKTDSNVRLLVEIFAKLTGQPAETVALDTAVLDLTDSINILRFQAHVKKLTSTNITIEDVLRASSIRALAQHLEGLPPSDQKAVRITTREGPPTIAEMVHTRGEYSQALRTRKVIEPILATINMSWEEVEEVFPVPNLSSAYFNFTRPKAYTIRMSFVACSASTSSLRKALETTLREWPLFRALLMRLDQQGLFATVRAGSRWSNAVIKEVPDIQDPQDLCSLSLLEMGKDYIDVRKGGILTHFVIANIKSTGTAGLVILANHCPHDALSMQAFFEDLELSLAGNSTTELRTSYKLFADMYYQYSNTIPAQIAIGFHVNRLRGIRSLRECCWPRQRCVGWHLGDDEGYTVPASHHPGLSTTRTQIDNDGGQAGLVGISSSARLNDLGEMRSRHKISAPVLFKAACALLNSHISLSREVLFINTQAGRQWPFLDPSIAKHLPNPLTIAGITLSSVLNRIQVSLEETVGSFLTRLEAEQQLLTIHAHAPKGPIASQLDPDDAAVYWAGHRQLLNWNPSVFESYTDDSREMRLVEVRGYTEVMLQWHCGIVEADVAKLLVTWDGCQAGKREVQGWADGFMKALQWVSQVQNWERNIEDLVW